METSVSVSPRSWRVIAHDLTHEMDPRKVMQLSEELNRALAMRGLREDYRDLTEDDKKAA